jgi:hypothetical protein
MKITSAALLVALAAPSAGFAPSSRSIMHAKQSSSSVALLSTLSPPERVAPDAGYVPDWEDRVGLTPEEFTQSDMSKPDLSGMWECPLTRWDSDNIDVKEAQKICAQQPHCPLEMRATPEDNAKGAAYFAENKDQIRADLLKYGAIWFRGFDLMKSVSGNREMHEALGLDPCLDPLHSSGLRKFASERDALYEEVSCCQFGKKSAQAECRNMQTHLFHDYVFITCLQSRFLSSDIRFLPCFEQYYRSTNHLSVVTTLAYITNPLPNVQPPTQLSYASNVPLRVVDVSSLPMVLPS